MSSASLASNIKNTFKVNLIPAIFLQILAVSIGLSYFFWPSAAPVFNYFSDLKLQYGIVYAIVSTSIFGGLIPFLYLFLSGKLTANPLKQLIFYCIIWAFLGAVVDLLYTYQAVVFGDGNDVLTIMKKTAVDQFIFSALLSCPFLTIAYMWKDYGFNWGKTKFQINKELFTLKIPTTVLTNWLIWIPAVSIIYAMPTTLQVPLFNLVLCFFVLLLSMLDRN